MDRARIVEGLCSFVRQRGEGIVAAYLFGSVARGDTAPGSDVDLAVLDDAPPDLVHRVLRDGIVVHDGDRAARIAFEVQLQNAYFDLQPILERYRRAALERR